MPAKRPVRKYRQKLGSQGASYAVPAEQREATSNFQLCRVAAVVCQEEPWIGSLVARFV